MLSLPVIKFVAQSITVLSVTKVVGNIIATNTVIRSNADKVLVYAGTLVLSSMTCDAATKHVEDNINQFVTWNEMRKADIPTTDQKSNNPRTDQ